MTDLFSNFDLTTMQWLVLMLTGALIGMAKAGVSGLGLMAVPLLASAFGGRPSVGLLLPILIFADVFAVTYYNRHAEWKHILRLIPWAFIGIVVGTMVGKSISELTFNRLLASMIIAGIVVLIWQDIRSNKIRIPTSYWFAITMGLLGGFATMVGNAAGPIMALYLLSMRLPKNQYIGTAAWFFFIINLSKVPLHIWSWETITLKSFLLDALAIPAVAAGAFLGIFLVKLFPEKAYRVFIIITTALTAFLLF